MRKSGFWAAYVLLLILQLLLSNYFQFTPYITLSILPVMVLCIPIRVATAGAMLIAAATGFTVDLLAEGVLGLNAFALIPVAYARNSIIRLVFGGELFARQEDFSVRRSGFGKVAMAVLLAQALFLLVFVWIDAAGTRPLWFLAARFGASLGAGFALSLLTLDVLAPAARK